MINCLIIEDEPAAQALLKEYICRVKDLNCRGIFSDAVSAIEFLERYSAELVFLDIHLPEMSGLDFLKSLSLTPLVIFTTAYSSYAIEGYNFEIVDFLLKPYSFERFCVAVDKARNKLLPGENNPQHKFITLKSDKNLYRVKTGEICFIEAMGDYLAFNLENQRIIVHATLKSWEEKLVPYQFIRIHRSTLVNLRHITKTEGNFVEVCGKKLRFSENYRNIITCALNKA